MCARQSILYETWRAVAVRVFHRGEVVAERMAHSLMWGVTRINGWTCCRCSPTASS